MNNTSRIRRLRGSALAVAVVTAMLLPATVAHAEELADPAALTSDPTAVSLVPDEPAETAPEEPVAPVVSEPTPEPESVPEPEPEPTPPPVELVETKDEAPAETAPEIEESEPGQAKPESPSDTVDIPATSTKLGGTKLPAPQIAALIPERALNGTVRDATGAPVASASISIAGAGVYEAYTSNPSGAFSTYPLPVGNYSYYVYAAGYPTASGTFTLTASGSTTLDPVLALYSRLSGTVTSAQTNAPLQGVGVFVEYPGSSQQISTSTDSAGNWEITNLDPGQATVRFMGPAGSAYQSEWFNNSTTQGAAQVLTLPATGTSLAIDASLSVLGGIIRGSVQTLNGNAPTQGRVEVYDADGNEVSNANTDANGDYLTTGLTPGTYTVVAQGNDGTGFKRSDPKTIEISQAGYHDAPTLVIYRDLKEDLPEPIARDDYYSTPVDTLLQIGAPGVLANDTPSQETGNEMHVYEVVDQPEHGDVLLAYDGSFVYSPDDGFEGTDTFTYTAQDSGYSEPATVTIEVSDAPATPLVANDDAYEPLTSAPFYVGMADGVLVNDTGHGTLRVVGLQGNASANSPFEATTSHGGTVEMQADGSFLYTPAAGFEGTDTFTYLLDDESDADPASATVRITLGHGTDDGDDDDNGGDGGNSDDPSHGGVDEPNRGNGHDSTPTSGRSNDSGLAITGVDGTTGAWVAGIAGFLIIDGIVLLIWMRRRKNIDTTLAERATEI